MCMGWLWFIKSYKKFPEAQCQECWKTAPWLEIISIRKKAIQPRSSKELSELLTTFDDPKEAWPGSLGNTSGHVWQAKAPRDTNLGSQGFLLPRWLCGKS